MTIKICKKWAYINCINCGKTVYKTLSQLEKLIQKHGSQTEVEEKYICRKCLNNMKIK